MNNNEALKRIADMLSKNIGNRITEELASGIYGFIKQAIEQSNKTEELIK